MSKEEFREIAEEAVKIYFNYNVSAEEAVRRAKEMILNEDSKVDMVKKVN